MAKFNDVFPGDWLKKEDFPRPCLVTVSHLQIKKVGTDQKEHLVAYFKQPSDPGLDISKGLIVKPTNFKLLVMATGEEDYDNWAGHQVVLYNEASIEMAGEIVGGIRVRRPKVPAAPTPTAAAPPDDAPGREAVDEPPPHTDADEGAPDPAADLF